MSKLQELYKKTIITEFLVLEDLKIFKFLKYGKHVKFYET